MLKPRTIAIGDIHGCSIALKVLIEAISPQPQDTIVTLGKIGVVGQTPQAEVIDPGYMACIDTGCSNGGWLTALKIHSKQLWLVNESGSPRTA